MGLSAHEKEAKLLYRITVVAQDQAMLKGSAVEGLRAKNEIPNHCRELLWLKPR